MVLVVGPAGSGKTTLALQMAFHLAAHERQVCFVSTTTEPPGKLLAHASTYSFYQESLVGSSLHVLNIDPLSQQGMKPVLAAMEREVREHGASLLILDDLMSLSDMVANPRELRAFMFQLGALMWDLGCAVLVTSSRHDADAHGESSEFAMADCLVRLSQTVVGTRSHRTLQVIKARGREPVLGVHTMHVGAGGVEVFQRFESLPIGPVPPREPGVVTTGLPELDEMFAGGLQRGSVTALAGAIGTGKTLFGLQFLVDGAQTGQRGLFFSLRETREELITKADTFGLDLGAALQSGDIVIRHCSLVDSSVDEIVTVLDDTVREGVFQRVVLEGLMELAHSMNEPVRRSGLMSVLGRLLHRRGITAVIPLRVPQSVGPELDLGENPVAGLAENFVLFRYVLLGSELYRILSILGARNSAFDPSIRQYEISDRGMRVLERRDSEGLLERIEQLASEARVKRREPEGSGQ